MSIRYHCPGCGKTFRLPDSSAGRSGRCHSCGHHLTIPAANEEPSYPRADREEVDYGPLPAPVARGRSTRADLLRPVDLDEAGDDEAPPVFRRADDRDEAAPGRKRRRRRKQKGGEVDVKQAAGTVGLVLLLGAILLTIGFGVYGQSHPEGNVVRGRILIGVGLACLVAQGWAVAAMASREGYGPMGIWAPRNYMFLRWSELGAWNYAFVVGFVAFFVGLQLNDPGHRWGRNRRRGAIVAPAPIAAPGPIAPPAPAGGE